MNRPVPVSPRHTLLLDEAFHHLLDHPPRQDHVIRTLLTKKVNDQPMIQGELVLAGKETRAEYPLACEYPVHFRKTYYPICFSQHPDIEFARHTRASEILEDVPPPIGATRTVFRSCYFPGRPLNSITPFGKQPDSANIAQATDQATLPLSAAIGLWHILGQLHADLKKLHENGFTHGDAELHNFIVTPAPAGIMMIDFELATLREDAKSEEAWSAACKADFTELLKDATYLMCALGQQDDALGQHTAESLEELFEEPGRFRRAIDRQAGARTA